MATYKEIHGVKVQSLDADPTAVEGDVWYNASTSKLKMYTFAAGTWASGGNLNTGRMVGSSAKNAPATASLVTGGETSAPTSVAVTETYDGSSWTEVGDLNIARSEMVGAGTATAALCISGYTVSGDAYKDEVESWNGTSWTEIADVNTARGEGAGCGTQTSAVFFSGQSPMKTNSEEWDGSSWAEGDDVNTARAYVGGCGVQTAALMFAGAPAPNSQLTESYNGTSWTEVGDLVADAYNTGDFGSETACVAAGGDPGKKVTVEEWNGTAWSEQNNISTGRNSMYASATGATAGYITGGQLPPAGMSAATEEWTSAIAAQTVAFD